MSSSINHAVFVDFENVPDIDLSLITGHPVRVVLLIGKNQKKLDLPLVQQIHQLGDRVQLIEVGASGRNALDLTLAYHLGQAVQQTPSLKFHIVSGDKDFDPLIAHLKAAGTHVARHPAFAALPFLASPKKVTVIAKKAPEDRLTKFIARLKNPHSTNRPAQRRTLLAHIKSSLGSETTDAKAEEIFRKLSNEGILTIVTGDKVQYPAR